VNSLITEKTNQATDAATAASVINLLSCPVSHGKLTVTDGTITSGDPAFKGAVIDGVAVMTGSIQKTFFDDKYETMLKGHEKEGEWAFCYAQQTALLTSYLSAGQVVLDVGCGPSIPYSRPAGTILVGLEPSFESIRANKMVDLRVNGTALAVPMRSESVDVIVCFYSIHHMVGRDIAETRDNVARAFKEFGRILKPGGSLFIFEMTPIGPFYGVQQLLWNSVRRFAPKILDMYFWSASSLAKVAKENLPPDVVPEKLFFGTSAFTSIPPIFNLPWLKIPRLFYPLDAKLYKWRIPTTGNNSKTQFGH
jgi:SAM-dependent methyltransferase